jgi:hypothetical protein
MTLPAPAGIATAINETNLAQDVAYVCRRVRVCYPYGCVWRDRRYWTRPRPHHRYRRWLRRRWWGGRWH